MSPAQSTWIKHWRSLHGERLFSSLPEGVVRELDSKIVLTEQSAGSVLYRQDEKAKGIFVLFRGRVKTTAIVSGERTALLKIAGAGQVLGLAALLSGQPHVATAEIVASSLVGFLRQEEIASAMRNHVGFAETLACLLATECIDTMRETLVLRVPCTSSQRLAAALLRAAESGIAKGSWEQNAIPYTHAELGQLIGASRETVTRLLKSFQQKGLVMSNGSGIQDRQLLSELAGG